MLPSPRGRSWSPSLVPDQFQQIEKELENDHIVLDWESWLPIMYIIIVAWHICELNALWSKCPEIKPRAIKCVWLLSFLVGIHVLLFYSSLDPPDARISGHFKSIIMQLFSLRTQMISHAGLFAHHQVSIPPLDVRFCLTFASLAETLQCSLAMNK